MLTHYLEAARTLVGTVQPLMAAAHEMAPQFDHVSQAVGSVASLDVSPSPSPTPESGIGVSDFYRGLGIAAGLLLAAGGILIAASRGRD